MVYVPFDSHFQRTCQSLEDSLYLVVLILSLSLNVEVHLRSIAKTLEEVKEHLCWHLSNFLSMEAGIPYQPWASAKVECYLTQTVVHRQAVAVALDASFVAKSL